MAIRNRVRSLGIPFESVAFPANIGVQTSGILSVTWDDLLWAAVTLGRPNLNYVFRHGRASRYEAIFRWSLVRMALEQRTTTGSRLFRTGAFRSLDPTEKGAISYFLGMMLCKLFADKLLDTPWLLHLDVFRDQLNSNILTSRSRPDLVGRATNSQNWHSFESKGRVSPPRQSEKAKAKQQAQRLVSVDGQNCSLHIGAITYFKNDALRFFWRDPEPDEPKKLTPIELQVPETAWQNYYEPIADLIRPRAGYLSAPDDELRTVRFQNVDAEIGVARELLPMLVDRSWQDLNPAVTAEAPSFVARGYRPDGLIVRSGPSWRQRYESKS